MTTILLLEVLYEKSDRIVCSWSRTPENEKKKQLVFLNLKLDAPNRKETALQTTLLLAVNVRLWFNAQLSECGLAIRKRFCCP